MINIPYDLYESQHEVIIIMPLGGVNKESITITIREHKLIIAGERISDTIREDLVPIIQDCFWGSIQCHIDLPPTIAYQKIHSTLSKENILTILLPKNFIPDSIYVNIETEYTD